MPSRPRHGRDGSRHGRDIMRHGRDIIRHGVTGFCDFGVTQFSHAPRAALWAKPFFPGRARPGSAGLGWARPSPGPAELSPARLGEELERNGRLPYGQLLLAAPKKVWKCVRSETVCRKKWGILDSIRRKCYGGKTVCRKKWEILGSIRRKYYGAAPLQPTTFWGSDLFQNSFRFSNSRPSSAGPGLGRARPSPAGKNGSAGARPAPDQF